MVRLLSTTLMILLFSACSLLREQIKTPAVSYQGAQLQDASLQSARVNFMLALDNPNAFDIPIKGISYRLNLHGKDMFAGNITSQNKIPAKGRGQIIVPVDVVYSQFLSGLEQLLKQRSVAYELKGEIDLGLLKVPYQAQGDIPLPELPSIQVSAIKINKIDLTGVDMALQLKLKNANAFQVQLDKIDYRLDIAGKPLIQARSDNKIVLQGEAEKLHSLSVRIGFAEVAQIFDILSQGAAVDVDFAGNLGIPDGGGNNTIPFDWNGRVPLSK